MTRPIPDGGDRPLERAGLWSQHGHAHEAAAWMDPDPPQRCCRTVAVKVENSICCMLYVLLAVNRAKVRVSSPRSGRESWQMRSYKWKISSSATVTSRPFAV